MKKITRKQLRNWGACYRDFEIKMLVPSKGITPQKLLALLIPDADKLWVLTHYPILSKKNQRLLICRWTSKACELISLKDAQVRNALTAARKFAKGAITKEQLFRTHVNVCDLYNKLPYPSIERYVAAILISATRYPQEFGHNCFAAFNCLLLAEQETLNASLKQTNELRYEIAKTCLKQTTAVLKKEGKL